MALEVRDISRAVCAAVADHDIEQAYLFGSFARGEANDQSDVDLRFACGEDIDFGTLYEIAQEIESMLGRPVEIITNPPDRMRPRFRERVLRDEVLLYESA